MPEPNIRDRNSYGSCVHEFRTAKLRRGSRTFAHDQVQRGWSKIITIFQWVLIFEQSVNHDADRDGGRKLARLRRGCGGGIVALALENRPRYRPLSRQAKELSAARICYVHLAGRLVVDLTDFFTTHEYIALSDEAAEITPLGPSSQ